MKLLDTYILEVTRRLPEKKRAQAERELRTTIKEMLVEDASEEDVKAALEKLGSPALVASHYHKQPMYLIGPRYFDVYVMFLKRIIPIAAMFSLVWGIIDSFIGYDGGQEMVQFVIKSFAQSVGNTIELCFQVFFWLTLIFAILERTDKDKDEQPLTMKLKKWTVDDLKTVKAPPKKRAISKSEVFWGFIWTAVWAMLYFYANQFIGIYEDSGNGLTFVTAVFNQKVLLHYLPAVVLVIILEVSLILYKFISGQWTKKLAIYNAAVEVISSLVFMIILVNPNLLNQGFITYMSNHFSVEANQMASGFVIGGIFIFVISAAINSFDGFRKALGK